MSDDASMIQSLAPFSRRARRVILAQAAATTLIAAAIGAELGWAAGTAVVGVAATAGLIAATLSGYIMWRRRITVADLARRIDRLMRLNDLIVSAVDCSAAVPTAAGRAVVLRAQSALAQISAGSVLPYQGPLGGRPLIVGALLFQAIVGVAMWQAPKTRPIRAGLAALNIPASGGVRSAPVATPPSAMPAQAPSATTPAQPTAPTLAAGKAGLMPTAGASGEPGAALSGAVRLTAGRETSAAVRVPLARRTLVERYFAMLPSSRKPPQ
jgi:hypothetical protein